MTNELMTPRQLAAKFNVEVTTVLRWARRGQIPAVRVGIRVIRFDLAEIEKMLQTKRSMPDRLDVDLHDSQPIL